MEVTSTTLAVNAFVGIFIPALVGIVATAHAPKWLLATLNLGFSAATGVATVVATATHIDWRAVIISFASTWVVSIATHFGFLKPSGASDALLGKGGLVGGGSDAPSPAPDPVPPAQPDPEPAVIGSDDPPADAPAPPDGWSSSAQPESDVPESLGLAERPAFLDTPAGRAAVRRPASTPRRAPAKKATATTTRRRTAK